MSAVQPSQSSSRRPSSIETSGELVGEPLVEPDELVRAPGRALAGRVVAAVPPELGGGDVERQPHVLAGPVAGRLDGADQHPERRLGAGQVRREAALVADAGHVLLLPQEPLQGVEDLRPRPERLGERGEPGRNQHELLHVEPVVRVGPPVDHVHEGDRQRPRVRPAEVPEEGEPEVVGGGAGAREGHAEDGVRPQGLLLRRAVELAERAVDEGLLGRVHPLHLGGDHALHVAHGLEHALAAEAPPVVVPELEGLRAPRRRAGRHGRAPLGPAVEVHLDLEGGVPAGVQDLARVDVDDLGHLDSVSLSRSEIRTGDFSRVRPAGSR